MGDTSHNKLGSSSVSPSDQETETFFSRIEPELRIVCDSNNCHPSVGVLLASLRSADGEANDIGMERCTASLIAPNLAITNAHCIPEDIRIERASCDQRVKLYLPAINGSNQEVLNCNKILFSNIFIEGSRGFNVMGFTDVAIFSLKSRSQRTPLRVTREGPTAETALNVTTMDGEQVVGTVEGKKLNCRPYFLSEGEILSNRLPTTLRHGVEALVVLLTNCPVRSGNSGSPVFNQAGHIIGLVNSGARLSTGILGIFSNFACMPLHAPLLGRNPLGIGATAGPGRCTGSRRDLSSEKNGGRTINIQSLQKLLKSK